MSGAIGFKIKLVKFNPKAVTSKTDRIRLRFLGKFGAFAMTTARRSIKSGGKKNKQSRPGEPPRTHVKFFKKAIRFAVDRGRHSVVIGPTIVPTQYGGSNILRSLEEGGSVTMREIAKPRRRGKLKKDVIRFTGKKVQKTIRARPYMGPAFRKEKTKIADTWRKAGG
jgi:hypothetical protein